MLSNLVGRTAAVKQTPSGGAYVEWLEKEVEIVAIRDVPGPVGDPYKDQFQCAVRRTDTTNYPPIVLPLGWLYVHPAA